jgi:hypothetical protein
LSLSLPAQLPLFLLVQRTRILIILDNKNILSLFTTDGHTLLLPKRGHRLMATDKFFFFTPCQSLEIRGEKSLSLVAAFPAAIVQKFIMNTGQSKEYCSCPGIQAEG